MKQKAVTETQGQEINYALLENLVPAVIDFKSQLFILGETYSKVMVITTYPSRVTFGWLSRICTIDGVSVKISVDPSDSYKLVNDINKSITEINVRLANKKTALSESRLKQQKADAERLLEKIDREGERVSFITVILQMFGTSEENINLVTRRVQSALASMKIVPNVLAFEQEAGFFSASPFALPTDKIKQIAARNIPTSTLGASIPFATSGLSDPGGWLMGRDSGGGILQVNQWLRGGDRTNANWAIFGSPGGGKSTFVKLLILNEYARGTHIYVIDPESEYGDMADALGCERIDMSGTGKYINPYQFREQPTIEDEEELKLYDVEDGKRGERFLYSAMAHHMRFLRAFYKLQIPDMNPLQMSMLEEVGEAVYQKHNITYDTDMKKLTPSDYPIIEEVYAEIQSRLEKDKENETLKILLSQLRRLAIGADKFLWNGHSNIDVNSQMTVLDTNKLLDSDDVTIRTQFFNIMTWVWQQILTKPYDERLLFIIDEAYLMADRKTPETLMFMRNIMKRCRKRNAGFIVITQSINDFIAKEVKQYGEELLNSPCFKLFLGTDGKNLEEIAGLYNLKEKEIDVIANKQRGNGLFIAGNKRMQINVMVTQDQLDMFGRGGGQ